MKIIIETIPHSQQRYPTCGDWFIDPDGTWHIKVSEMDNRPSEMAVAIHELVELFLITRGFEATQEDMEETVKLVDEFDKSFTGDGEPGDSKDAPYNVEHSVATAVERLILAHLGVFWQWHDERVENLFEE